MNLFLPWRIYILIVRNPDPDLDWGVFSTCIGTLVWFLCLIIVLALCVKNNKLRVWGYLVFIIILVLFSRLNVRLYLPRVGFLGPNN